MTRNVTGLPSLTRGLVSPKLLMPPKTLMRVAVLGLGLVAFPGIAFAQVQNQIPAIKAATGRDVDIIDAILTPLSDLNLARDAIPIALLEARADPYRTRAIDTCAALRQKIGDLDAVLGEDFDSGANPSANQRSRTTPGNIAKRLVATLIPFRGIVREVSGANSHDALFREAIIGGLVRRSYLKGLGQERGCAYPARPVPRHSFPRIHPRPVSLDLPQNQRDGRLVWERG